MKCVIPSLVILVASIVYILSDMLSYEEKPKDLSWKKQTPKQAQRIKDIKDRL